MVNGSYLILLDLSAAFDTIDHDTLFVILEKYVGITGSANPIFQTDHSECECYLYEHLVCGVPQGSVLGSLTFCF